MGFGQAVYKSVLEDQGRQVITVDPVRPADFKHINDALAEHQHFGTVNICTPNYTHESIARSLAAQTDIIFVEKPGVRTATHWQALHDDFPKTRFMMVKNNQYRTEIEKFKDLAQQSNNVYLRWNNKNRIPNPGSWFTNKYLSFGGVSRDLMPHLLSYVTAFTDYTSLQTTSVVMQNFTLPDITSTDYGVIDHNGVYNVDDYANISFVVGKTRWILEANWKNNRQDDASISFDLGNSAIRFELGLCPESAYNKMIQTAIDQQNNADFWKNQFDQDIWIHQQLERM